MSVHEWANMNDNYISNIFNFSVFGKQAMGVQAIVLIPKKCSQGESVIKGQQVE